MNLINLGLQLLFRRLLLFKNFDIIVTVRFPFHHIASELLVREYSAPKRVL